MGKKNRQTKEMQKAVKKVQQEFADRIQMEFRGKTLQSYAADRLKNIVAVRFPLGTAEDGIRPEIASVTVAVENRLPGENLVQVELKAAFDFSTFQLELRKTANQPFYWRGCCSGQKNTESAYSKYVQSVNACMQQILQKTENEAPSAIPVSVSRMRKSISGGKQTGSAGNAEWCAFPKIEHIKSLASGVIPEVMASVQPEIDRSTRLVRDAYTQKANAQTCPAGFQLVAVQDVLCTVSSGSPGDYTVKFTMKTDWEGEQLSARAKVHCFEDLCLRERTDAVRSITQKLLNAVSTLTQRTCSAPVTFVLPHLEQDPDITPELADLLTKGSARIGHVKLKWLSVLYRNEPLSYCPEKDYHKVVSRDSAGDSQRGCFPLISALQTVGEKGELKAFPDALPGLAQFCMAFSKMLEAAADKEGGQIPEVLLTLDSDLNGSVCCGSVKEPLEPFWRMADEALQDYTRLTAERCAAESSEVEAVHKSQVSVLNRLNPTQLQVLQYIYQNGQAWYSGMIQDIGPCLETTQVYARGCLEYLCKVSALTWGGLRKPLVRVERKYSMEHGEYYLYLPNNSVNDDVFQAAVPRDYTVKELDAFDAAKQKRWFLKYLQKAETPEERWKRFSQAIEKMPKTFLVEFAKSESGADFLRQFQGEEREFVRMYLESLPGCKRRAKEIYPD